MHFLDFRVIPAQTTASVFLTAQPTGRSPGLSVIPGTMVFELS